MIYVYACVVGIKAPESLCYLLMYIKPTLNKDYLLTYSGIEATTHTEYLQFLTDKSFYCKNPLTGLRKMFDISPSSYIYLI